MKSAKTHIVASTALCALTLAVTLAARGILPEQVPMQWGLTGEASSFWPRDAVVFGVPGRVRCDQPPRFGEARGQGRGARRHVLHSARHRAPRDRRHRVPGGRGDGDARPSSWSCAPPAALVAGAFAPLRPRLPGREGPCAAARRRGARRPACRHGGGLHVVAREQHGRRWRGRGNPGARDAGGLARRGCARVREGPGHGVRLP